MALTVSEIVCNAGLGSMELLDLLFDHQHGILRNEGFQDPAPTGPGEWPIAEQNLLTEQDSNELLNTLLCPGESVSGSPLWSPATSDSGISEEPSSDQPDSPQQSQGPDSPYLYHPPSYVKSTFSHTASMNPEQVMEPQDLDVSIDLDGWESGFYQEKAQDVYQQPGSGMFPLTVKDLLLNSISDLQPVQQTQQPCQELVLNEDEKKLLAKEGISLPSQLPLTKYEERILKKIRRKIRNKQSAQESRKKKKEYIDGLESRMAACNAQNQELQRKVFQLEKHNMSLVEQLRKLQALVMNGSKAAQTGTCIMVLVLSFSLIFPSLHTFSEGKVAYEDTDFLPVRVQSRSLHDVAFSRFAVVHEKQPAAAAAATPDAFTALPEYSGEEGAKSVKVTSLLNELLSSRRLGGRESNPAQNLSHDDLNLEAAHHLQPDPISGGGVTVLTWPESHGADQLHPLHADEM
ncbi:cyclic AMP-responsive element-binding protein 3-like protein 3-A isoform X1 [Polypterus senegalus]|uniref:cyclic AMP-responsive element-binding protein 3-like protein 3-A isoform X1 n=1 Tax=Polypterus senegalus TaxID=55291 RepID=UPI0019669F9C|nr:cyclic AMP-responsive element-binding protein 3-like protein 3-A isoform X1 [Polypterus senegalus]